MKFILKYLKATIVIFIILSIVSFAVGAQSYDIDMRIDYSEKIIECVLNNDRTLGIIYEDLRDIKKNYLGLSDNLSYDNLKYLSNVVFGEAGSYWLSEYHRRMVASVVLNRVQSVEFPNNIYDVLVQRGQYSTKYVLSTPTCDKCIQSAAYILINGSIAPKDVVFQANFKQGGGVYTTIYDKYLGTTYFCYSNNRNLYVQR